MIQSGVDGYDEVTYSVTYVNGVETGRVVSKRLTILPVKEVINIGAANEDAIPPTVNSIDMTQGENSQGKFIKVTAKITDNLSGVRFSYVSITSPTKVERTIPLFDQADNVYSGVYQLSAYAPAGFLVY